MKLICHLRHGAAPWHRRSACAAAALLMFGCAAPTPNPLNLGWFQPSNRPEAASQAPEAGLASQDNGATKAAARPLPPQGATRPTEPRAAPAQPTDQARATSSTGADLITVNFDQLPLPAFIQSVYASILKRPVSIDAAVAARTDLVTFRASKPVDAAELARVARQLLRSYGIAVQDFDGLVRFTAENSTTAASPQVRRGRAQPDVPAQLRPMYYMLELDVVRPTEIGGSLRNMFGNKLQVADDIGRSALLISGQPEDVMAAIEIAQLFDQPLYRGTRSIRLTPANWSAEDLGKRIREMMTAQGYSVAFGTTEPAPLMLLPVPAINALFLFSGSDETLQQAVRWAEELDKPSSASAGAGSAFYTFHAKNTDATNLARLFGEVLGAIAPSGGGSSAGGSSAFGSSGQGGGAQSRNSGPIATSSGLRIVVNPGTNSIIVQGGKAEDYRQWTQLLGDLDKPGRSALIEVVVAEVKLTNNNSLGVEWSLQEVARRNGTLAGGTLGGLSVPTAGGLSLLFRDNGRQVRGLINALAAESNARILSSPKIIAKNGESATIQVGEEVPVITSQQSNSAGAFGGGSGSGVTQQIQYRNTGVILKVKPVIHSNNRLDLEVSQEVSSPGATQTGVSASPTISSKRVDTRLSMRDGATVLLAGLISETTSGSNSGVPLAKDVPVLGNLFKNQSENRARTELVVLITSYVINDDSDAEAMTDAFRATLGTWAQTDLKLSRPPLPNPAQANPASSPGRQDAVELRAPTVAPAVPAAQLRDKVEPGAGKFSSPTSRAGSSASVTPDTNREQPALPPISPAKGPSVVSDAELIKELDALRRGGK